VNIRKILYFFFFTMSVRFFYIYTWRYCCRCGGSGIEEEEGKSRREQVLHNNGSSEGYSDNSAEPGNLRKQVLHTAISSLPSYYT
jgi:hypothetical protein